MELTKSLSLWERWRRSRRRGLDYGIKRPPADYLSAVIICLLRCIYTFADRRGRRSLQGEIKLPYEDRRGRRSLQGEIKLPYEDRRGCRSLQEISKLPYEKEPLRTRFIFSLFLSLRKYLCVLTGVCFFGNVSLIAEYDASVFSGVSSEKLVLSKRYVARTETFHV